RAAEHLSISAEKAWERGDFTGAQAMFERSATMARGGARARVLWKIARVAERAGDFARIGQVAVEAIAEARAAGDRAIELLAEIELAESRSHTDVRSQYEDVTTVAQRALEELEAMGDRAGANVARETLARFAFFAGRAQASLDMTLQVFGDPSVTIPDRERLVIEITASAYFGPAPAEEVLEILERCAVSMPDTPLARARYHQVRTAPLAMLDRADEAHEAARIADAIWTELGDDRLRIASGQIRGEAERYLERWDLAEAVFRDGMERLDRAGEIGFNSTMTALLATSLCDLGRFDDAVPLVEKSRSMTSADDVASQNAWRLVASRVAVAGGDAAEGLALAEAGLSFMETTDYIAWIAESHERIGEAALAAGDVRRARIELAAARDGYHRKQILRWIRRLETRLAEL
ncbi:MAG TPA: hypothetical protein VEC15_08655, partial [Actinomycetota bacterium]|nr:hypothetical protein [Actinomycetota bacterium]